MRLFQPKVHKLLMGGLAVVTIIVISPLSVWRFIATLLCILAMLWLTRDRIP